MSSNAIVTSSWVIGSPSTVASTLLSAKAAPVESAAQSPSVSARARVPHEAGKIKAMEAPLAGPSCARGDKACGRDIERNARDGNRLLANFAGAACLSSASLAGMGQAKPASGPAKRSAAGGFHG